MSRLRQIVVVLMNGGTVDDEDHEYDDQIIAGMEVITDVFRKAVGHKIRSRFGDDYGQKRFVDGYNQAKEEILNRTKDL